MKKRIRAFTGLTILAAVLIVLAGCTPSPSAPSASQTLAPGEVTPTGAADATPELPVTGGNKVEVQLKEYTITMPTSIPAGQTTFEVTNVGTEEHGFDIEGQGIQAELERHLQPGETLTLEVNLTEGTYEIHCPVDGHAAEGMRLNLTVTAP